MESFRISEEKEFYLLSCWDDRGDSLCAFWCTSHKLDWFDEHFLLLTLRSVCSHSSSIELRSLDTLYRQNRWCVFLVLLNSSSIVWGCALGRCPVVQRVLHTLLQHLCLDPVGNTFSQSSSVHVCVLLLVFVFLLVSLWCIWIFLCNFCNEAGTWWPARFINVFDSLLSCTLGSPAPPSALIRATIRLQSPEAPC